MRCIHASSDMRNENTMIAIATIRLKLTSTAAMLTVARRAVPRNCATAIWRQAGPDGSSQPKDAAGEARRQEHGAEQQAGDGDVAWQCHAFDGRQRKRDETRNEEQAAMRP